MSMILGDLFDIINVIQYDEGRSILYGNVRKLYSCYPKSSDNYTTIFYFREGYSFYFYISYLLEKDRSKDNPSYLSNWKSENVLEN